MWIVVALAIIAAISVLGYRQVMATTQVDAHLRLDPLGEARPRSADLQGAIEKLTALGYTMFDELTSTNAGSATNQKTFARLAVLIDRAGTTWAIAYELTNLLPSDGSLPDIGAQMTTVDLVSILESGRIVTTSNAKLGFFDKNPKHAEKKIPMVGSLRELVEIHADDLAKETQTSTAKNLRNASFNDEFISAWLEGFEFQASRGLFVREGEVFKATPKLARRGVLNYWMPLADPQGWRWLLHLGWTGLIVTGLGAYLQRAGLVDYPALAAAGGLGAIAGGLGAGVFHPTSVVFTMILGALGDRASGTETFVYPVAVLISYIAVDRWRGRRIAAVARRTLEDHGSTSAKEPTP